MKDNVLCDELIKAMEKELKSKLGCWVAVFPRLAVLAWLTR